MSTMAVSCELIGLKVDSIIPSAEHWKILLKTFLFNAKNTRIYAKNMRIYAKNMRIYAALLTINLD
jgi:hypothetical protein